MATVLHFSASLCIFDTSRKVMATVTVMYKVAPMFDSRFALRVIAGHCGASFVLLSA